jgi:transcription antitermination factor NusG
MQVEQQYPVTGEAEERNPIPGVQKWFALIVAPRHEKAVAQLLQHKGYETFLPVFSRKHQYGRKTREFQLPLFPGYLFCRVDISVRLPILMTPGVLQFLGAGRLPIPIDEDEIAALQRAVQAGVPMTPHIFWQTGQKGRITSGPLAGVEGIVMDANKPFRLILSVSLLQRSVLLEIDADCVISAVAAEGLSPRARGAAR